MSDRTQNSAVTRGDTNYIFTPVQTTGSDWGIQELSYRGDPSQGDRKLIEAEAQGEVSVVRTIHNTPVASTLVWDDSQINLYYLSPFRDTCLLREICQKDDQGWITGALSDRLWDNQIFPDLNSDIAVWNDKEKIKVYFTTGGTLTLALYDPSSEGWSFHKV